MRERIQSLKGVGGFTLTELLIALLLFLMLITAISKVVKVNITAGEVYAIRSDISQALRESSNAMVDQLRGANTFVMAQDTDVVFQAYITGTDDLYNVEFFLQDGNLVYRSRRVVDGNLTSADDKVITGDVLALDFDYYEVAGTTPLGAPVPTGSLAAITRVEIKMTVAREFEGHELQETIITTVRIRV